MIADRTNYVTGPEYNVSWSRDHFFFLNQKFITRGVMADRGRSRDHYRLERSWWLRRIKSCHNYFQAASKNKDPDKVELEVVYPALLWYPLLNTFCYIPRMNLKDHKWAVNIYECPAGDILDLRLQMDLNASICINPWSYYYDLARRSWIIYFTISFHVSLANVNLHMWFSTTVWNNFTMQHELGLNVTTVVWMAEIYE